MHEREHALDSDNHTGTISDTQHGSRSGGTLHSAATTVTPGFMSAADKTKLDGISSGAALVHDYQFGRSTQVPGAGSLQLVGPGDTTVPVRINRVGVITGASVQVDTADIGGRNYDLQVWKNGASVATVALVAGAVGNSASNLNVAVAVGDLISAYLVRTAGAGASTFANEHAMVEVKF